MTGRLRNSFIDLITRDTRHFCAYMILGCTGFWALTIWGISWLW